MATQTAPARLQVQLTAAGVALAAGGPLFVANGRGEFRFAAGEPLAVDAADWQWLATHRLNGLLLFELVPAVPAPGGKPSIVPDAKTPAAPNSNSTAPSSDPKE